MIDVTLIKQLTLVRNSDAGILGQSAVDKEIADPRIDQVILTMPFRLPTFLVQIGVSIFISKTVAPENGIGELIRLTISDIDYDADDGGIALVDTQGFIPVPDDWFDIVEAGDTPEHEFPALLRLQIKYYVDEGWELLKSSYLDDAENDDAENDDAENDDAG